MVRSVGLFLAKMSLTAETRPLEDFVCVRSTLDKPESALLLRLTKLVERVFEVPVAYIAVLGADLRVTARIGSGREHWDSFQARKPLSLEFPMRRHDGVCRWMHVRGIPRLLPDGKFAGSIGCLTDITDHRPATLELHRQKLCVAAVA